MRFIKPSWLTHGGEKKDFEVYSCHVSPDGSRLVTAAGDGYVRVWSTEAIYNAGNPEYTKPKQLASMSYHSGTIHTVRFSPNGKYLASGADDKIVCVYTLDPNAPSHASTFGTNEAPPVESWRIFRRLIGHDNDVQDLGWSYDSSILVSVGLDSKVVVWSGHTFEKLKTLSHHQSHVKGLTFDPANKYFATASDDRTIKVFRFTPPAPNSTAQDQMNNFHIEFTIIAPFASSPLTTYFRRCSWSPDGNHIAAANAVNGPVSSVAIVNRGSWDSEINLIGHEGPVEVCAFSPRLFCKEPPSQVNQDGKGFSTQHLVTVIACAGQDKALSIWNTSHPRPLVITQDLAVKSISDLAWSPDGRHLFATSLDGSVISVVFEEGELGYVVGLEENEKALAKFGAGRRGAGVVEGTDGLLLEERSKAGELKGVQGRMGELMGDSRDVAAQKSKKGGPDASTSTPDPATVQDGSANQSGQQAADGTPAGGQTPQPDQHTAKLERLKQRVTITKDGKKRIAPLLVSSSGGAESSMPRPQLMAATASAQAKADAPQSIVDLSKPFDGLPKGGLAALLLGNKRKAAHIEGDEDGHVEKRLAAASRGGAVPILVNGVDGLEPATPAPGAGGVQPTPEFIRPAVVNPSLAISQVRLAVPKVRTHIVRSLDSSGRPTQSNAQPNGTNPSTNQASGNTSGDLVFEARNPSSPAATARLHDRDPAKLTVTRKGQTIWQDFLPRPVLLTSGNRSFWTAACEDGSVYVWTPAGRRLLNALVLEAQPVILEVRGSWVLCITAVGMCHVWNVKTLSSPHPPLSLAPVLDIAIHNLQTHPTVAPAVTSARLNSKGYIIVTLSNGDGYVYSPSMYVWQRLSEAWWAVGSQYWNTTDATVGNLRSAADSANAPGSLEDDIGPNNLSAGIIPHVERNTTNEVLLRGRAYFLQRLIKSLLSREGYEGFESSVSIAHLENRLSAALHLEAKEEFRTYLDMYAKRLGAEGLRTKVEELLSGLLGGVFRDGVNGEDVSKKRSKETGHGWYTEDDELCGWNREDLLRSVLLILGKHRDLQRVTVPYAKLLGVMDLESTSATEDTQMT
ncbi:histone transcription regulator HIRA, WD repeat superfamily [Xylona heveae TC161]|uniref:Protein HIR n=1 Tax=Xylona heveae (strain CBS 132557 / TC161) TaxID=1328760 RepID=A0A164Z9J3_XYLHT|nr:histone transcription regulator HIRA, WD repeat superfamily [Xylona heveae TC161]KZF18846.1 histone transcription regulator HIRA, WD repeat superfamily [Xylona heveae TC161]